MCYHESGTACENQIEKDNHLFRNTDQISSPTRSKDSGFWEKKRKKKFSAVLSQRIIKNDNKHVLL